MDCYGKVASITKYQGSLSFTLELLGFLQTFFIHAKPRKTSDVCFMVLRSPSNVDVGSKLQ